MELGLHGNAAAAVAAVQRSQAKHSRLEKCLTHGRFPREVSCWGLVYRATRRPQPPQLSGAKAGTGGSVGVLRMTMFPRELS